MEDLRIEGLDAATLGRSTAIAPPEDRPHLDPVITREMLAHLLVLPCYPRMGAKELERQAKVLRDAVVHPDPDALESQPAV